MMTGKHSQRTSRWTLNPSKARARMVARANGDIDSGVSLMEVMVAFVILMITMVPIGYLLTSTVAAASNARQREAALQLADSWTEILSNSTPPENGGNVITNTPTTPVAPTGVQTPKSTLAGTTFTVTANYTLQSVANVGTSDLCEGGLAPGPTHPGVIQLEVTVWWDNKNQSLTDTTNVDYPQPGVQTDGYISLQLTNDTGQPSDAASASRLEAVPVTLTGAQTLTLYPDSNGCVFAQVPTGAWTVQVGPVPSISPAYVTTTGATSSTQSVTVNVTADTTVQLSNSTQNAYDQGILVGAITYSGSTAVDDGVQCPGTASLVCVTTGNGSTSAATAWGGTGSTWSSTNLSGVTNIANVACTSASTPTCVGVGYGPSGGVIVTTQSNFGGSITSDTVPTGVTEVNQVTCPSANGCYALATTASGPVLLAGAVGQTGSLHDSWKIVAPASTVFTSLSSIACPGTTSCELTESATVGVLASAPAILNLSGDPATLATTSSWTPTFTTDTLPSTVTAVTTITCPTSSLCLALALKGSVPTVLSATIATTPPSVWAIESTFPTTATSLTGLSCTSTTCVAIGTMSGTPPTPGVWTADLTQSTHDWAAVPNTILGAPISAVTSVACGNPLSGDTASCAITANTTSVSTVGGVTTYIAKAAMFLVGSLTGGSWTWNEVTPSSSVQFYDGVACEPSPSSTNSACAAVGATSSGPVILTSSTGPSGNWIQRTPSTLPGTNVTGIPLETTPAGITNWTTQVAAGSSTNATSLSPVFYPQPSGYSIVAGDCAAEATSTSISTFSAQPGGSASTTVPLGRLPLKVVSILGVPMSGAIVTLTSTSCGGAGDSYTLPATDANGYTRTAVPYGTYTYTVTSGSVVTPATGVSIAVYAGAIGVTTSPSTTPVTTFLPASAQVVQ